MRTATITLGVLLLCVATSATAQHAHPPSDEGVSGSPGTITGHVTDAACLMRHPAAGAPNSAQTLKCAQDCIAAGSPLVVLTAQGKLYFVISGTTPDVSQNKKYLPYVGKYVKATGRLLERDGIRAIAIESMEVVPAEK